MKRLLALIFLVYAVRANAVTLFQPSPGDYLYTILTNLYANDVSLNVMVGTTTNATALTTNGYTLTAREVLNSPSFLWNVGPTSIAPTIIEAGWAGSSNTLYVTAFGASGQANRVEANFNGSSNQFLKVAVTNVAPTNAAAGVATVNGQMLLIGTQDVVGVATTNYVSSVVDAGSAATQAITLVESPTGMQARIVFPLGGVTLGAANAFTGINRFTNYTELAYDNPSNWIRAYATAGTVWQYRLVCSSNDVVWTNVFPLAP